MLIVAIELPSACFQCRGLQRVQNHTFPLFTATPLYLDLYCRGVQKVSSSPNGNQWTVSSTPDSLQTKVSSQPLKYASRSTKRVNSSEFCQNKESCYLALQCVQTTTSCTVSSPWGQHQYVIIYPCQQKQDQSVKAWFYFCTHGLLLMPEGKW